MKKTFLIVALAILGIMPFSNLRAQNKFEMGMGYAPLFLEIVDDGILFTYKWDAYFEWRYQFGKHFDTGIKLDYKTAPISVYDYTYMSNGTNHTVALEAFADYSFLPGKKVNPFIGIGIGPALIINNWTSREFFGEKQEGGKDSKLPPLKTYSKYALVVTPRIGVELFRHFRISASVDTSTDTDIRWPVCFNVGWVF